MEIIKLKTKIESVTKQKLEIENEYLNAESELFEANEKAKQHEENLKHFTLQNTSFLG
jgi:predicted  nucleic acid-binding Zn-ribbon protein